MDRKVQDSLGSSEIPLRTDSAREVPNMDKS
jgi:hypothetical protein